MCLATSKQTPKRQGPGTLAMTLASSRSLRSRKGFRKVNHCANHLSLKRDSMSQAMTRSPRMAQELAKTSRVTVTLASL